MLRKGVPSTRAQPLVGVFGRARVLDVQRGDELPISAVLRLPRVDEVGMFLGAVLENTLDSRRIQAALAVFVVSGTFTL